MITEVYWQMYMYIQLELGPRVAQEDKELWRRISVYPEWGIGGFLAGGAKARYRSSKEMLSEIWRPKWRRSNKGVLNYES